MASPLFDRAQEFLPAGGTRLHRAILKGDAEAIQGWVEAGADPWALSAPLSDKLRVQFWGQETRGRRKVAKGPPALSAVALAVLLATDTTWPAVKVLLSRVNLADDVEGWVFEAACRSKAPPSDEAQRYARLRQETLPPGRPAALWTALLEHGLLPPARDVLPSQSEAHPRVSAFAHLPTEWRQQMEQHLGLSRLFQVFQPRYSPLDGAPPGSHRRLLLDTWLPWIQQGMPMADPQATLLTLAGTKGWVDPEEMTALAQALVVRGAQLDRPWPEAWADDQPHRWPTAASRALEVGHPERAVLLQALQGRAWGDSSGAPGSLTPAAELLARELTGLSPLRFSGFFRAQEAHLRLDETGSQATGWRQVLNHIPLPDKANLSEVLGPFRSWLAISKHFAVPDTGMEEGQLQSATLLFMNRVAQTLVARSVWLTASYDRDLATALGEWAEYNGQPVAHLAQAHLTRLAQAFDPAQPDTVLALGVWAPALTSFDATVAPSLLEQIDQRIRHRMKQDEQLPVLVERLFCMGFRVCEPTFGQPPLWDELWPVAREDILEYLWASPSSSGTERKQHRQQQRQHMADPQVPISTWFYANHAPVLALTPLEQMVSLERLPNAPSQAMLHALSADERALALRPLMDDIEQRQAIPSELEGRWDEARAFLRQLDATLTQRPEATQRSRPRRRT